MIEENEFQGYKPKIQEFYLKDIIDGKQIYFLV
jgi:hypothetical protein